MPPTKRSASPSSPAERREARAKIKARAERAHETYVQKTYGLAPGEYQAMLTAQDGRCAICGRLPRRRRLAVDHDHNTGRVRALLCHTCNHYVLRYIEHDPIASHNAAVYIAGIARDYGISYDPLPPTLVEPRDQANKSLHLQAPVKTTKRTLLLPHRTGGTHTRSGRLHPLPAHDPRRSEELPSRPGGTPERQSLEHQGT